MSSICFICGEPITKDVFMTNGKQYHKKCYEQLKDEYNNELMKHKINSMKWFYRSLVLFILLFIVLIVLVDMAVLSLGKYLGLLILGITGLYIIYMGINK